MAERTAKQAYKEHSDLIKQRLLKLQKHLNVDHRAEFEASDSKNWGHVGDLAMVNEQLQSLMVSFGLEAEED